MCPVKVGQRATNGLFSSVLCQPQEKHTKLFVFSLKIDHSDLEKKPKHSVLHKGGQNSKQMEIVWELKARILLIFSFFFFKFGLQWSSIAL